MKKILIITLGMILLMGIISADISESLQDKVVEETIDGVIYTFPTLDFYCDAYQNEEKCGETEYQIYKDSEIIKSVEFKQSRDDYNNALNNTDKEEEGIFMWIVNKILELLERILSSENDINKIKEETCLKDNTYSWCKSL